MTTTQKLMTADELLAMPDDGFRYELVRGELRKIAPSSPDHGEFAARTTTPLAVHVFTNRLGVIYIADTGFMLESDPDHVRAPDAAFVRRERVHLGRGRRGYFPGAPDVAIEVISPGDTYTDVDEKVGDYLDAGTQAVIVINPRNRTARVHFSRNDVVLLTVDDTLDISGVVEGWSMPVRDIFE